MCHTSCTLVEPAYRERMMSLHKLTAGDGYTYLTRQVAAMDATERGTASLAEYYTEKGESAGVWMGSGLGGLSADVGSAAERGAPVSEQQMRALFGDGRHPDADAIEKHAVAAGGDPLEARARTRLGSAYLVFAGSTPYRRAVAEQFVAHNVALGAQGDAPIADEVRASIRTEVGRELFAVEHGRPPADARELTGFIARGSRQATTAVAGYDLTFSPVKSASALWATAPREIAEQVEAAHHAAVADAVAWLETNASFTRLGAAGVRQVDTTGLIGAAFTHRDSRAGDPDLHTHVAISNKVQTVCADGTPGRWLALDGRVLHKAAVAASERYNTRLEAQLVARLGVQFADREDGTGKRAVREIVGIDGALNTAWSSRRAGIEVRRAELVTGFQARHGRAPSSVETLALSQQATLETRAAKHEPRSHAEQRQQWHTEAVTVLGGERALARMIRAAVPATRSEEVTEPTTAWVQETAAEVLSTVSRSRATWQPDHIRAEAERAARSAGVRLANVDRAVDAVVAAALADGSSVRLDAPTGVGVAEPGVLQRADGASVYTVARTQLFTSQFVIDAEARLLAAAARTDGRVTTTKAVDLALLESTANGRELNPGQVALVRELATSGSRVRVALAPAGTGKTTALGVLARAWAEDGGTVLGLAPTAAAAGVLRDDLAAPTDTLDKLVHAIAELNDTANAHRVPAWVAAIGPRSLVVVDEAGMAGTQALDTAVDFVLGRGGSVRLVGDDHQLASVSAGGVVRDIAETMGAVTLSHVIRFANPVEGDASLALRTGDTAGIGFYLDNDRVHVGDSATVVDGAYRAWATDRDAGLDAVMLAPTRDTVTALNLRARADRLALQTTPMGREVALRDGATASAGDLVTTRRNDRRLVLTANDWVRNGDRWHVQHVGGDGSLQVRHLTTRRVITLPGDYVAAHVDLGYARTLHSAQGLTADAAHTVATGAESRQMLYVAMTRGRTHNHLYVQTVGDGDPHTQITPDVLRPPTAVDVLARMVGYDGSQHSATTTARVLADPAELLHHAAGAYDDALGVATETVLGAEALHRIDTVADEVLPQLTSAPAYPALRAHLCLLALGGADPEDLVRNTANGHELGSATDPAAVLDWRLDHSGRHSADPGPLPWLPAIPAALADDPTWGPYLCARLEQVTIRAADVVLGATAFAPTSAPPWARPLAGHDPALLADLAVWRAATGVDLDDRRPTGPDAVQVAEQRYQRVLEDRVRDVLGDPLSASTQWASLARSLEPRLLSDPFWPVLAEGMSAGDRAGLDVKGLAATAVRQRPLPDELPATALWWRLSNHFPADNDNLVLASRANGDGALVPDMPHAQLPVAEQVVRISADLDAARTVLRAARQHVLTDTSPHLVALLPVLTSMRNRADELRPLAALEAAARELSINTEVELKIAEGAASQLGGASANIVGTNETHPLASTAADLVAHYRAEALVHRNGWDAAHAALLLAAGPEGVITGADVDQARLVADGLDTDALAAQREVVRALEGQLVRAENHLARDAATAASMTSPAATDRLGSTSPDSGAVFQCRTPVTNGSERDAGPKDSAREIHDHLAGLRQRLAHLREQRSTRTDTAAVVVAPSEAGRSVDGFSDEFGHDTDANKNSRAGVRY